ncbi:ABC transporter permease [Pseudaeromonas sp. ZJS20]|uniref:ABC transporter permease n=1 Tax=Pseudaeromonas aegiceratis TaxID=3153928 RepID=UPI00390C9070
MRPRDLLSWVLKALARSGSRTLLSALGIAIGIAAVVTLTGIGEGLRGYLLESFSQFGSRVIAITPGVSDNPASPNGLLASSRPLTLEDGDLLRHQPHVQAVIPVLSGTGQVKAAGLSRDTSILGTNHEAADGWRFTLARGHFLPKESQRQARPLAVLGHTLAQELFADRPALGAQVRIGERRFRVVGVMAPKGQFLGFDLDDMIFIPAGLAQALFNREGLMEIDIIYDAQIPTQARLAQIDQRLSQRHGRRDFTLYSQEDMLGSLDKILRILSLAIGSLGTVSLLIGAVGIFTIMTIAQQERLTEIGLLRALGAPPALILALFLAEAMLLALLGGMLGLLLWGMLALILHVLWPGLPLDWQARYLLLALGFSALVGLTAGLLPAGRAMALDPVAALRDE